MSILPKPLHFIFFREGLNHFISILLIYQLFYYYYYDYFYNEGILTPSISLNPRICIDL